MGAITDRQAISLFRRAKQDPVWFVEEVLGQSPSQYQCEWLEALRDHPRVAIASCHDIGKSRFAGGMAAPWFLMSHVDSELVTTAPTYRQVVSILWKELRSAVRGARIPLGGRLTKSGWYLTDHWFGVGFTASEYGGGDKFQGLHARSGDNLVIVDEAAGVSQRIYDEGIAPILSSVGSRCLLIGNPTSIAGEFRYACSNVKAGYRRFKTDAFQTQNFTFYGINLEDIVEGRWRERVRETLGYLPPDNQIPWPASFLVNPIWVEGRVRAWGVNHPAFQSRVLAMFPPVGEDALIPAYAIEEAKARDLGRNGWHRWGVDFGGTGPDPSVIGEAWESGRYRRVYREGKSNLRKLPQRIALTARKSKDPPIAINVDNLGIGLGPYDYLRGETLWDEKRDRQIWVCAVNFAEKAWDTVYINRRAELYWELRERFMLGQIDIDPTDDDLIEELINLRYKLTDAGRIQIESKDRFRSRADGIGRSCDNADAMCYAFAELENDDVLVL